MLLLLMMTMMRMMMLLMMMTMMTLMTLMTMMLAASAILAHLVPLKVDGAMGLATGPTPAPFALGRLAEAGVLLSAILAHLRHDGEPTVL